MVPRQWRDVLSYAMLSHGVLWTAYALLAGTAWGLTGAVSRRVRRGVRPGVLAVAVVFAGVTTFLLWIGALVIGVAIAVWVHPIWTAIMVAYFVFATSLAYAVAKRLALAWLARRLRVCGRVGFWLAVVILAICFVIQWTERPRLSTSPETAWKDVAAPSATRQDSRPNIVLVVLDTQRVDRLGCYGYPRPTTPRLDAFAADALVFDNCLSAAIWTLPSHASIFTGLFPGEHGATHAHGWLDDEFETMAELLGRAGYETIALTNNAWIGPTSNLSQGFSRVIFPKLLHGPRGNTVHQFLDKVLYPGGYVGRWLGAVTSEDEGAKFTNQLLARWLDERDCGRPFFLFVNYLEPHYPYRPHLPHRQLFVKPEAIDASYQHVWPPRQTVAFSLLKQQIYTPAQLKLLNDTYDGETRMLDDYVGEMLQVLAERIPLNESLVIITSDHGENLGDHHMMSHSWCVYDSLAHVPLIIRYPRRLAAGRRKDLVQTVDLLPTVMDAVCGRPIATKSTFGQSLLPPQGGKQPSSVAATSRAAPAPTTGPAGRAVVVELMTTGSVGLDMAQGMDIRFNIAPFVGMLRAIRQGPWKYILSPDGREELYHVASDPGELNNQIDRHRPTAKLLRERLEQWVAAECSYKPPTQSAGMRPLDPRTRQHLHDLGYLP